MQEGLLKWGHPGDHVKTVHEEIFINYGLRSFGLTFRTSRFARQVPQLAALALHTSPKVGIIFYFLLFFLLVR